MKQARMNILISSAGKRVSLVREFQTELKKVFPEGRVFTTEMNPEMSPAAQISDGCFRTPHATVPEYVDVLLKICVEHGVRVVIPTIDTELTVLSLAKERFAEVGIVILVSDEAFIRICRDKRKSGAFFVDYGIPAPKAIDRNNPTFPLFAKPYDGSLSKDTLVVNSREELTPTILENPKLIFMEYIDPRVYTEFTVDMYFGKDNCVKAVVPRERVEVRAGEINKGIVRKNLLSSLLRERFSRIPGVVGCICAQFFLNEKTGDVVGIEINPRFGGGYPLSYGAGANFPQNIIREYLLNEDVDFSDAWADGTIMLRYDAEVFVRPNPRVVVFDLDDTLCKEIDFLHSAFREIAGTLDSENTETLFAEMLAMRSRGENVFEALSGRYGVPVSELLTRYRAHVPTMTLVPGARLVLETLRAQGVVLGLITDGRSLTQRNKISALGLDKLIPDENIIISEEFGSEKPSLKNYEFFMKKYPGAEYCYVGDNPKKDFVAPNALGWETVCILNDGQHIHLQQFEELRQDYLPKRKIREFSELLQ